jgi:type II restriction enzyme
MTESKLDIFVRSITYDILPIDKYVEWDVVNRKVHQLRREIALLESLDKKDSQNDLVDILLKFPFTLNVLKLLIAHTPEDIWFADGRHIIFSEDKVRLEKGDTNRAKEIAQMFSDMGLFVFLSEVKSVHDLVKGVLIGLQPNSRKNWRGSVLEDRIKRLLQNILDSIKEETGITLTFKSQININLEHGKKKVDYVILKKGDIIAVIEVNFYSTSGSKPSEVLERAYPDLQTHLKKMGLPLIVITDGKGWLRMRNSIERALYTLDHCLTIKQVESGALKQILLNTIGHHKT